MGFAGACHVHAMPPTPGLPARPPPAPQPHEQLKGRSWVLESDLKSGAAVRLDKTGKTLLTLLRHLGR